MHIRVEQRTGHFSSREGSRVVAKTSMSRNASVLGLHLKNTIPIVRRKIKRGIVLLEMNEARQRLGNPGGEKTIGF